MPELTVPGPFGPLTLTEEDGKLTRVCWGGAGQDDTPLLTGAGRQLAEYFAGTRREFDLPIAISPGLTGRVMRALLAIPFGETRTYGELARAVGASARAVGQACGANPLPILVPCHRVLAAGGLGGYSAPSGIETKVALLRLEGAASLLL